MEMVIEMRSQLLRALALKKCFSDSTLKGEMLFYINNISILDPNVRFCNFSRKFRDSFSHFYDVSDVYIKLGCQSGYHR